MNGWACLKFAPYLAVAELASQGPECSDPSMSDRAAK